MSLMNARWMWRSSCARTCSARRTPHNVLVPSMVTSTSDRIAQHVIRVVQTKHMASRRRRRIDVRVIVSGQGPVGGTDHVEARLRADLEQLIQIDCRWIRKYIDLRTAPGRLVMCLTARD